MSRFEAIGDFVYEKGDRIGCTAGEASIELARKLNAYQMRIERLKAEVERLNKELEFSKHRMISLAEALADTRLGYQKKVEILKDKLCNQKCDQGANKADNEGKPSRPGGKGEIIGDKPQESGGAY